MVDQKRANYYSIWNLLNLSNKKSEIQAQIHYFVLGISGHCQKKLNQENNAKF